jgi:hypothetical protein
VHASLPIHPWIGSSHVFESGLLVQPIAHRNLHACDYGLAVVQRGLELPAADFIRRRAVERE